MEFLKTHGSITTLEYIRVVSCHERTARKDLADLVRLNVVVKQGLGKAHPVYHSSELPVFPGGCRELANRFLQKT